MANPWIYQCVLPVQAAAVGYRSVAPVAASLECDMGMRRPLTISWIVLLLIGPVAQSADKKPQPPKQKPLQKAMRIIRQLYRTEIKSARTNKQKSQLAGRLLQDARDTNNDATGRFALLVLARDTAIQAGDVPELDRVLRSMGELYEMDQFAMSATSFARALRKLGEPEQLVAFATTVARLGRESAAADRYAAAKRLAGLTTAAGRRAQSKQLVQLGADLRRELEVAERQFGLAKAARLKLKKDPRDAAANATVGRYLCLTKQEWPAGLPFLARGNDKLRPAAAAERKLQGVVAKELVQVGDLWWDLAKKERKQYATAIKRHAASLYKKAMEQLTGLARVRVERRIQSIPKTRTNLKSVKVAVRSVLRLTLAGNQRLIFRRIEPGRFTMGSPINEFGRGVGERAHVVELTKGFYLGATEVTQAQWLAIMGNVRSFRFAGATRPADSVTWEEANQLLSRLNKSKLGAKYRFRLPTEAEWEYACRAGSSSALAFGAMDKVNRFAWYKGNSMRQTRPVGTLRPNAWGLYDMNGNVWEWCSDWAGAYPASAQKDPQGPRSGNAHRIRGGSFVSEIVKLRAAYRAQLEAGIRNSTVGLRLVCERR